MVILIFRAAGLSYELVRLACPRNPTERERTEIRLNERLNERLNG